MKTTAQQKFNAVVSLIVFLTLVLAPEPAYAQWPPFSFRLTPSYENGRISYSLYFSNRVDWPMTDVTIKIPLPVGTRFVEGSAQPTTSVDFDGAEVTFFNYFVGRPIRDVFFVVEVTDPEASVFTTHAWISWQGAHPGDYLTKDISFNISKQTLNWQRPRSRLQLDASAAVADKVISYAIYPRNVGGRIWDLRINVPVPEGTTFLSAEAPYPFQASFDGQEVSFFATELERWSEVDPLSFQVSTEGLTAPLVVTHAWANWRNVGRRVPAEEDTRTGDIIVQPQTSQWVVSDAVGDVPLSDYDLTEIAFEGGEAALKITFHTVGEIGPLGDPLEYSLYIDGDCRTDTGQWRNYRGAEHWVRYRHRDGQATFAFLDEDEDRWRTSQQLEVDVPSGGKTVSIWLPYDLLGETGRFCWTAQARNLTRSFSPNPPADWLPSGENLRLTQFDVKSF